jgi:single-stranded-DNA-specific exonuclease
MRMARGAVARRWVLRQGAGTDATRVADALVAAGYGGGAHRWLARLLVNRDLADPDAALGFLSASLSRHLRSPELMKDMRRAATRLADAIRAGERIAVFGDYDVDGISGSAQLILFLRALGADPGLYVPHRLTEGYGLNEGAVHALAAAGTRVMVTADCGTANARELAVASRLGIDVIVCDHHHVPVERPPAWAVLNPLQPDCGFPFKGLSGAGVVFYLLMGLRTELRARGIDPLPDLRRYLDLVTLGTVADVVPLRDENRVLVKHGLRELGCTTRPGITALKEVAQVDTASVQAVGFRLGPRLNAGGRLADARKAVELLTTDDLPRARAVAADLDRENGERQALERQMVAEAVAMVEQGADWRRQTSIVVGSPDWHPGVVGIVAARLVERYYRPTFVFALGDETARGSGRSIRGLHLYETVRASGAPVLGFGGHRAAAGATVRRADLGVFATAFETAVRGRTRADDFIPQIDVDAELSLAEITADFIEALAVLEPCGPGNPAPTFLARGVEVVDRRDVGPLEETDGRAPHARHLKLLLRQGRATVSAIGFRMGGAAVPPGGALDIVFTPEVDRWQGMQRVQLRLLDMRPASS